MEEKLYNVQLTEKEIQVLNIGTAQFLRDLHTFVYKPFYIESVAEEHKPMDAQKLKNLMLAKEDLDTLTAVIDKLEKVRESKETQTTEFNKKDFIDKVLKIIDDNSDMNLDYGNEHYGEHYIWDLDNLRKELKSLI